ncbi:radical SAM domain-containing protein [Zopfochytrium polystomum]|nr:radical SAM domain-containing protein [Zopfochytrium polystomum]
MTRRVEGMVALVGHDDDPPIDPSTPNRGQRKLRPRSIFDEEDLDTALAELGVSSASTRRRHLTSIYRSIIQKGVTDWDEIAELPKAVRAMLKEGKEFTLTTSRVVERKDAKDGSTTKMLIELQDKQRIETVIMRYGEVELASFPEDEKRKRAKELEDAGRSFRSNKRATVCVSSQVGCAMGCTFCATGTMGLLSNLTAGEIIEQLYHANQIEKIRNVVFMGMGEPLDNYKSVLAAVDTMVDTSRFALSYSRITVSTVGVVPKLRSLIRDAPQIGLALSLHAPNQELRTQIVPTAKNWHITKIVDAAAAFVENQNQKPFTPPRPGKRRIKENLTNESDSGRARSPSPSNGSDSVPSTPTSKTSNQNLFQFQQTANSRRHILIEYVLIANVNDSRETAEELAELLAGMDVLVNVIPYNPTDVGFSFAAPSPDALKLFVDTVKAKGLHVTVRQELGQDIASACGQLVVNGARKAKEAKAAGGSCAKPAVTDLEDLLSGPSTGEPRTHRKADGKRTAGRRSHASSTPTGRSAQTLFGVKVEYLVAFGLVVTIGVFLARRGNSS